MGSIIEQLWVVLAVLAAVCVVGVLHCAAAAIGNQTYLHDLKVRVATLRVEKLRRLREGPSAEVGEVDIQEDDDAANDDVRRAA